MHAQDRFGQERKAHRQSRGEPRPPKRYRGPRHLLIAVAAHDVVDDRSARRRALFDAVGLTPGFLLLLIGGHAARSSALHAPMTSVRHTEGHPSRDAAKLPLSLC